MELTQDTSPMRARNAAVSTLKAGGKKHRLLTRDQLDGRTNAAKVFDRLVTNIEADLGGRDQLSTIELALIEAFLWRCCHARWSQCEAFARRRDRSRATCAGRQCAFRITRPPPRGTMGKREPQIILKTDERSIHPELGREREFNHKIQRLG
jgi:hypothetical protein